MSTNDEFYWDSETGQWVHAVTRSAAKPNLPAQVRAVAATLTKEQAAALAYCKAVGPGIKARYEEKLKLRGTWSENLVDQATSQQLAEHMRAKYGQPASDNKKDREDSNRDAAKRFAKILKKRTGEGQPKKAEV